MVLVIVAPELPEMRQNMRMDMGIKILEMRKSDRMVLVIKALEIRKSMYEDGLCHHSGDVGGCR